MRPSRRAIFRGLFGSRGFALSRDVANETLMRATRSLDPIPLTDGMWTAFLTARRRLRYWEYDGPPSATSPDRMPNAVDRTAELAFGHLPAHITRDLTFLLRVETQLRMWSAGRTDTHGTASAQRQEEILLSLEKEIRRYLRDGDTAGRDGHEAIDHVLECLTRAAGIAVPSATPEA